MNSYNSAKNDVAYQTLAALFLTATSPTAAEHEADGAFRALRRKLVGAGVDPHAVADRIRGCETFAPRVEEPPTFAVMSTPVKRVWLDTITLRLRLSDWERRFCADVRTRALSSLPRLSAAQARTLQKLVDRAWDSGVRP